MDPAMTTLPIHFYPVLILAALLGGWLSILLYAYVHTGDAGADRLPEKFPAARAFDRWYPRWNLLVASLLILWILVATICLVLLAGPAAVLVNQLSGAGRTVLILAAVSLAILLFRIVPVAVAESYSDRIAVTFLPYVIALSYLLYPIAKPVSLLEGRMREWFRAGSDEQDHPSSEDEIMSVVDDLAATDLEEDERDIIRSVLEFGDTMTREIMTHRVDIVGLEHMTSIRECIEQVHGGRFSRFPVYAGTLDDVRGMIHVKDLLRFAVEGREDRPIVSLSSKITFVPETMPINDLFKLLRAEQAHLAVVVDEYGGTAGLVSMEDIIEELVGEIHDEYDTAESHIRRLSDHSYLLDARTPIHEVNEQLELKLPEEEEYDSIGGYIFHLLGHIPRPGERIDGDGIELIVHTASANRIHTLRLLKKEPMTQNPDRPRSE